jgi:type II secretory pathway pseudopilin PulG
MDIVLVVASVVSAVSTAILGFLAFRLTRATSHNAAERAIGDLHRAMAAQRVANPDILSLAPDWTTEDWDRLYDTAASSMQVVRYYSYVEMGLEFCNTTLRARSSRQISKSAFEQHYRPLVRYFIAENWPIIDQMAQGPYLSGFMKTELRQGRREGWDWSDRHARLVRAPQAATPQDSVLALDHEEGAADRPGEL